MTDGVWAKLDQIWIFAAENAKSALIDLKGLATATSTGGIAPSFTADRGYTGNAAERLHRYLVRAGDQRSYVHPQLCSYGRLGQYEQGCGYGGADRM